jgi:hypothetical protein
MGDISRDGEVVMAAIYKEYLKRRKDGQDKDAANEFEGAQYIKTTLNVDMSANDISATCRELKKTGYLDIDVLGFIWLTNDGIVYMENKAGRTFEEVTEYIKSIPFLAKLLY